MKKLLLVINFTATSALLSFSAFSKPAPVSEHSSHFSRFTSHSKVKASKAIHSDDATVQVSKSEDKSGIHNGSATVTTSKGTVTKSGYVGPNYDGTGVAGSKTVTGPKGGSVSKTTQGFNSTGTGDGNPNGETTLTKSKAVTVTSPTGTSETKTVTKSISKESVKVTTD